jgi:hypothetical protein
MAAVADIDRALLAFLRQGKSRATASALESYGRQYLGFFRKKRRYVFINAFPRYGDVTPENAQGELQAVCDDTWGVEFDVATQKFSRLLVDGGPPPFGQPMP